MIALEEQPQERLKVHMKLRICLFAVGLMAPALCLQACAPPYPPSPTEVERFNSAQAKEACDVTSLAEEHEQTMIVSNDLKGSIAPYQNRAGYNDDYRITIVADKLRKLDAEIDASYRFVVASCTTYNLCLANNRYDQGSCGEIKAEWEQSRSQFASLSTRLRKLSASSGHSERARNPGSLAGLRTD